jgi:hypothetical protein
LKLKLFLVLQVLAQMLRCGLTKYEAHGPAEADQAEFPEKEIDIENQRDNPQNNAGSKTSSSTHSQNNGDEGNVKAEVAVAVKAEVEMDMDVDKLDNEEDEKIQAPLLSLFVTVCDIFISADEDLSSQFGNAMSLPKKLEKIVADYSILTVPKKLKDKVPENSAPTVHALRLMKLTCKMVISMMKHRGCYLKEDLESLTEALSSASERMSLLDVSMVFAREDGAVTTMKPVRSLDSLVKEAKESVDTYFKAQESGNIEPLNSTDG